MISDRLVRILKALGDPARLKILNLLPISDECCDVYNVSELSEELGIPQPTVSHHLNVLRNAGIVSSRKMCRDVYYWINIDDVNISLSELNEILLNKEESNLED